MAQPDNFSLYQPLVAGALWMAARGLQGPSAARSSLGGLLAGLATLSRNDGVLVGAVLGLVVPLGPMARVAHRRRPTTTRSRGPRRSRCVALFVLVMAPWWIRQLAVFGSLSPSTASGKVLFIRDIGEWNSITTPATLDHLLGMGIGPLLMTRIGGAGRRDRHLHDARRGRASSLPFMVIGGWARRRSVDFGPFFVYAAILFAFSALVSAVHVPGRHVHPLRRRARAARLHPRARGDRGRRRLDRGPPAALEPRRGHAAVHGLHRSGSSSSPRSRARSAPYRTWDGVRVDRKAVGGGARPRRRGPGRPVMSIDAAGFRYWTGRGGVVAANDPLDTIREVAEAYDIAGSSSSATTPSRPSRRSSPARGRRGSGRRSSRSRARTGSPPSRLPGLRRAPRISAARRSHPRRRLRRRLRPGT